MFTEEERAKWRQLVARWKAGEKVFDAGKRIEKTDATTVQRQEPVQPIKRQVTKSPVVPESWVEKQQQSQPTVKSGNTYKTTPRPQTFAGRVSQVVGGDWVKADMTSAATSQIPVIGQLNGALDFGYDFNNSAHNLLDTDSHTNTAMSGIALLPYVRNGLKMLKGKTWAVKLRNAYDAAMTRYNTSREVNKALKAAKLSDAAQDGTSGVFDEYGQLDTSQLVRGKRTELRKAYSDAMKKANDNLYTLVVNSRPVYALIDDITLARNSRCLYTGDIDTRKNLGLLNRLLGRYPIDEIGVFQVPHHGSKENWQSAFLGKTPRDYVVSAGTDNSYHHPDFWAMEEIRDVPNNTLMIVTEKSKPWEKTYNILQVIHQSLVMGDTGSDS